MNEENHILNLLNNIVTKLVQEKRRSIRSQVLSNERDFFGASNTFYDLLSSPSSIFVNTNHGKMGTNALKHCNSGN